MPVVGDDRAMGHRDGIGTQMRIERLHQAVRLDVLLGIQMAAHRDSVHARIGSAGAVQPHLLAQHAKRRFFDCLLDARPVLLPLEAEEGCPVEFESKREAGHRRTILPTPVIPAQAEIQPTLRTGERVSGPPPSRG